jgi:hypothetical protein
MRTPTRKAIAALAVLALSLALALPVAARAAEAPKAPPVKGCNCLFMGHSFFAPIARHLPEFARPAGVRGHKQHIVFHGGANGSPGRLWASDKRDVANARKLIETGTIDLIGLTFYPNISSDPADYRRWVDVALKYNPETRFFIVPPWTIYQGKSLAEYEERTQRWHTEVHAVIDELRKAYPKTTFFCVPQGDWMVALWRLYEKRELTEITSLEPKRGAPRRAALFADHFGHGGPLVVRTAALVWLTVIYDVDPRRLTLETGTKADLQALAWKIARECPYARNAPRD